MTIVQINTFPYKATGTIMMTLHRTMQEQGYNSYVVWGRGRKAENEHEIPITDDLGVNLHGVYTRLTDRTGFASFSATKKLLNTLDKIKPDIIHIHNLHGYYINIDMLFEYIKNNNISVVWTLHDCWAFTGHCAWFDACGCQKWKTCCHHCQQLDTYPASLKVDSSKWNYMKKKEIFTGANITLVTPSKWLEGLVKESFLSDYPVKVIHNGLDMSLYNPHKSNLCEKYNVVNKRVILGVASEWTKRKGLEDFVILWQELLKSELSNYKIILVGLNESQIESLPSSIIGLKRTSNLEELLELYTMADVYFNPTYEDNYPTTNIEAIACGTPVLTYDTGGSPESVLSDVGTVFPKGDINGVVQYLKNHNCHKLGFEIKPENYKLLLDSRYMVSKYLSLYEDIERTILWEHQRMYCT
jgi:glycosyltransferase involved in cell wall biosynthesis